MIRADRLAVLVVAFALAACSMPPPPSWEPTKGRIITPPTRDASAIVAAPTATATAVAEVVSLVHVVQPGDTLSEIAAQHGVSVEAIQTANSIDDPSRLKVGQELVIPLESATVVTLVPETATPTFVPSPTPQPPSSPVPSSTPMPPAATATDTPIPPAPVPTDTPTSTATHTPVPTPTATMTSMPTPTPTATDTPVSTQAPPPTATAASVPTVLPTPVPAPQPETYVVRPGDTLTKIANAFGVTVQALQEANGIQNPSLIRVGEELIIPPNPATVVALTAAASQPTATPTETPAPTPTPTAVPEPSPTPTEEPLLAPICRDPVGQLLELAEPVELPSGASILVPPEWTAGEVAGLGEPLPYLSEGSMSAAIYLVERQEASSIEASLELIPILAGGARPNQILRQVDAAGDTGVAAWDQRSGGVHHLLVGYVGREYLGVLATTAGFCPKQVAYGPEEARSFASLLEGIVGSYRPGAAEQ